MLELLRSDHILSSIEKRFSSESGRYIHKLFRFDTLVFCCEKD